MKPVISDAEVEQFRFNYMAEAIGNKAKPEEAAREALSAFLLARVPEELGEYDIDGRGFNACREQVLQGRGDKT
jgi:hypothetical protein